MSGVVSAITKVFSSLGTGVAQLGSAVRGVGASLFTTGAATGSSIASAMSGGGGILSSIFGSGGVLGNMLSGAASIMGLGPPGGTGVDLMTTAATGATGATGASAATGATGYGTDLELPAALKSIPIVTKPYDLVSLAPKLAQAMRR